MPWFNFHDAKTSRDTFSNSGTITSVSDSRAGLQTGTQYSASGDGSSIAITKGNVQAGNQSPVTITGLSGSDVESLFEAYGANQTNLISLITGQVGASSIFDSAGGTAPPADPAAEDSATTAGKTLGQKITSFLVSTFGLDEATAKSTLKWGGLCIVGALAYYFLRKT